MDCGSKSLNSGPMLGTESLAWKVLLQEREHIIPRILKTPSDDYIHFLASNLVQMTCRHVNYPQSTLSHLWSTSWGAEEQKQIIDERSHGSSGASTMLLFINFRIMFLFRPLKPMLIFKWFVKVQTSKFFLPRNHNFRYLLNPILGT